MAYFFGGLFLANAIPHLVAGHSGRAFPTPFAKPPFRGFSSPTTNILWGLFNLAMAYVLLVVIGALDLHRVGDVAIAAAGFGLWSLFAVRSVATIQRQRDAETTSG